MSLMSDANSVNFTASFEIKQDQIIKVVNEYLTRECSDAVEAVVMSHEVKRKMVPELVKELVYSHKDEIIEQIVNRAVTELVKKGLPKLLERMGQTE